MKKKKILFFFATMLLSIGMAHADDTFNGVLVTVPDGSTTYALTEMPKISYTTDGTTYTARLFIKGKKFFTGGKLIIIGKDGKQYDATGKIIK